MTKFKTEFLTLLMIAVSVMGCTASNNFSKYEGKWALDIDSTMSEIVALRLDVPAASLADMREALMQQSPQMNIKKEEIQITLKDATSKLDAKLMSQSGDCGVILVGSKHQMQYCISGIYLRIKNMNSDKTTITEVYKRVN